MIDVTFASCDHCQSEGEVQLPSVNQLGPLVCLNCHRLLCTISVEPWRELIDCRVAGFTDRQRSGQLGTRKQAAALSDPAISRDGLEAELAACLLLCPGMRDAWFHAEGPNRGTDLLMEWTLLPKPVEVKQTRYCDERRGCLIVRPPRNTPGQMRPQYIDDCIYVLMHGQLGLYTLLGWADREHLLACGELNPIPVFVGRRECWGAHWQRLYRPNSILNRMPRSCAGKSLERNAADQPVALKQDA